MDPISDISSNVHHGIKAGRPQSKSVCTLCRSRVSGHKTKCNRPMEGHGCTACKRYGLPCVFGGVALPTYPGPVKRQLDLSICDGCKELGARCDLKRPCDRCHSSGRPCTGEFRHCFHRGVPGDDMYGYYLNLGFGPGGVDHVHYNPLFAWEMPYNYNLEYLDWEKRKALSNEVVKVQRNDSVEDQYTRTLQQLKDAVNQGVPINVDGLLKALQNDVDNHVPLHESQVARDLLVYLSKRPTDIYPVLELPVQKGEFNIFFNEADLQRLNPGSQAEYSHIAPIRNIVSRVPSHSTTPGPARPQYWIPWTTKSEDIPIFDNTMYYPEGRPERINLSAIRREPFRDHPNENAESVLSTVPFLRLWDEGEMYPTDRPCQQETNTGVCGKATLRGCEDTSHIGDGTPICDECEATNREKFYAEFSIIALQLRQYLCHQCSNGNFSVMKRLEGTGSKVYYVSPPGEGVADYTSDSVVSTGLTQKEAASDMRIYMDSVWGKQVCPLCKINPGINDYDFKGVVGGENGDRIWVCLVCHSYVFTGNTTGLLPRRWTLGEKGNDEYHLAPPPYAIRKEEQVNADKELARRREAEANALTQNQG
ncbi:hypothetical protein K445DRAFT_11142 [Daldinia sp. EC12]|nr:hypothetical protein K445DRAFT_11142 [Daldinia sp. EC12]